MRGRVPVLEMGEQRRSLDGVQEGESRVRWETARMFLSTKGWRCFHTHRAAQGGMAGGGGGGGSSQEAAARPRLQKE